MRSSESIVENATLEGFGSFGLVVGTGRDVAFGKRKASKPASPIGFSRQFSRQSVASAEAWRGSIQSLSGHLSGHFVRIRSRQISRHFGGIAESCGPVFRHPAIDPAKMAGSSPRTIPRTFCPAGRTWAIATPIATSRRDSRGLEGEIRNPDNNPDKVSGFGRP